MAAIAVARPVRRFRGVRRLVPRYAALLFVLFLCVGPLLWQLSSSLKGRDEPVYGADATLVPHDPSLQAYLRIFEQVPMAGYIANSLVICALSLGSQLVLPTMAGYMLSRRGWRGAKAFAGLLVASMMFPFEAIMVSLFLMTGGMGLVDTLVGVWLPGAVSAVNVFLMRAAFSAMPDEVEDAAVLDGATEWQRFLRIYLPAVKGSLTVVAINTFISAWDDFLWPFVVLRSEGNFTLSLGLSRLAQSWLGYDPRVVMAGSMIAILPVIALFVLAQRWFYRGVAEGAIK
ncbi:carbohydrate ABC transporter permease [Lentzea kentuckyensis]|uniref:carbohydrate ABC transporter permease n=1 Tax=Lentzea kentuckyensis TaxID=360086 RepID=UPI000A3B299B|nr:carbohydrate ABC transporter permease [Lentzea kentuckyensis]